jgi:hypothetical protein
VVAISSRAPSYRLVADVVARVDAARGGERRPALPTTMMLFGMINSTYT